MVAEKYFHKLSCCQEIHITRHLFMANQEYYIMSQESAAATALKEGVADGANQAAEYAQDLSEAAVKGVTDGTSHAVNVMKVGGGSGSGPSLVQEQWPAQEQLLAQEQWSFLPNASWTTDDWFGFGFGLLTGAALVWTGWNVYNLSSLQSTNFLPPDDSDYDSSTSD